MEVKFGIHITEQDGVYGVTLFADDNPLADIIPCFRSVFRGEPGLDPDEVSELYAGCHQDAMDQVGLDGHMDEDVYEEKLSSSIILAGTLMKQFSFEALTFDDVPAETLILLFADDLPEEETDPKLLN